MQRVECDVCGGDMVLRLPRVVDPQTREAFAIAVCQTCDLGQTVPTPADPGRYYGASYFGGRHGITERICMRRRLRFLNSAGKPGRLLDFGCGDGGFLLAAEAAGWRVQGVETNPDIARARGLDILSRLDELVDEFDAITLWHSLEHVLAPGRVLSALSSHLKPGGYLLVAVPNRASWQSRLFGAHWFHLDVPRHLSHFTPSALRFALEREGLEVVESWNLEVEIDWFGWPQSLLNMIMPTPNVLFDTVTGRPAKHSRAEVAGNLLLGGVLALASAPLVPLAALARSGAVHVMAARKPVG